MGDTVGAREDQASAAADPDMRSDEMYMPKMILQTLVENAIIQELENDEYKAFSTRNEKNIVVKIIKWYHSLNRGKDKISRYRAHIAMR